MNLENRMYEWMEFDKEVCKHILLYTIEQYGDYPNDQATEWSSEDCIKSIQKYCNRFGRGKRGKDEALRDLLKIAHYACMCWGKETGLLENRREIDKTTATS